MRVLYVTNIPSPYRIEFFELLGQKVDLTVVFEARRAKNITFDWNDEAVVSFKAIFLNEFNIEEKKINWKILSYINETKYDCIVFTNYAYYTEIAALLKAKLFRMPYMLEIDGGLMKTEHYLKRVVKKFFILGAKRYLSPSKASDKFLMQYSVAKERIERYPFTSVKEKDILTSLITVKEKEELRKILNIKYEKVVISVGQFIFRKGYDILLEACRNFKDDVGIYIIGGVITKEYKEIIEKYNLSNVHFIPFKTKQELANYYKLSDIFVLPTREDIWGLVINEAMCYGLPIVTTDRCGAGLELIENGVNGYLVSIENSIELSKSIKLILYNSKLSQQMSINNLNKIRNYTIKKMVESHMNVFKKEIEVV